MRLFEATRSLFRAAKTERAQDRFAMQLTSTLGRGPRKGTEELLALYKDSPWLRAVTRRIAEAVASVPLEVWKPTRKAGGNRALSYALRRMEPSRRTARLRAANDDGLIERVEGHPIELLLENRSARMHDGLHGHEVAMLEQIWLDVPGESLMMVVVDSRGMPAELWPVPPSWIEDLPRSNEPYFKLRKSAASKNLPRDRAIYRRDLDVEDPYGRGSGTGIALGNELDTDEYASKWIAAYLRNNFSPEAFVGIGLNRPGTSEADPGRPSADALRTLKQQLIDDHQGPEKRGGIHLTNYPVTVAKLSQEFTRDLLDLRTFDLDAVTWVYGVPPEIVGILKNANKASITQAERFMAKYVVLPRLDARVRSYQNDLVPLFGPEADDVVLGYESPMPDDLEEMRQLAESTSDTLGIAERRALLGYGEGDPNDVIFVPLSTVPMKLGDVQDGKQPLVPEERTRSGTRDAASGKVIDAALAQLTPTRLTVSTRDSWSKGVKDWITRTYTTLGITPDFELLNPFLGPFLASFAAEQIPLINGTTRNALAYTLAEGAEAGEGYKQLAARVRDVFGDADRRRSELIARTETLRGSNGATYIAYKTSGVVERKQWIGTADGRARPWHEPGGTATLDGVILKIDDEFKSPETGATALYPGGFRSGADDCNCRCTIVNVADDRGYDDAGRRAIWTGWEKDLTSWDSEMAAAFRAGFALQLEDVLAAMERAA